MNEVIGLIIITVGVAFDFFGVLGLLRLPDVYNRLQAATKCITLGTCGIMLGTFVMNGFTGLGIKALNGIEAKRIIQNTIEVTNKGLPMDEPPSPSDDFYFLYVITNRVVKFADWEDAGNEVIELPEEVK